jgi:hypothetical protein
MLLIENASDAGHKIYSSLFHLSGLDLQFRKYGGKTEWILKSYSELRKDDNF